MLIRVPYYLSSFHLSNDFWLHFVVQVKIRKAVVLLEKLTVPHKVRKQSRDVDLERLLSGQAGAGPGTRGHSK